MIGKIFAVIVIFSVLSSFAQGRTAQLSSAALQSASKAVELCISLLGSMCLWSGIARVLDRAGFTAILKKIITPLLKILYPVSFRLNNGINECAASISANLLGLGNAALPLGLSAVKKLQENCNDKDRAGNEVILFAVLATAPFQLLPTTLAAMREATGSAAPYEILVPVWICQLLTGAFAILICKLMAKIM